MEQINQNSDNDVNGSGSCGEASSSSIGMDATQVYLGRYPTTAEEGVGPQRGRKRWTRLENREVMECYIDSEPEKRGYRKRMVQLWHERGLFAVSEQRLVDQVRQIKLKGWVTAVEIDEVREQRRRTATQSDVAEENVENDVNEIIRQENTS